MNTVTWEHGETGRFTVGNQTLEYACYGPPPDAAPTIVMLHEGLGCLALWREFPQEIAAATKCGVFVFSRAGYGQSDPVPLPRPLDYLTREAVDVLPHVLDAVGFQGGILLGHSDGAAVAAIYTGSHEDHRVRGLILIAPHFFTEDVGIAEIANVKEQFKTGDLRERLGKYHSDPENAFRGWSEAWLDPGFRAFDICEVIDYLRVPVLAIQGTDDEYGTLEQIRTLEERCYAPVDVEVYENCGHAPFKDQPARTLAAVKDFAARLARIESATADDA